MSWWGKLAGGAFGFMMGGPLGALLGVALGHQFDRGVSSVRPGLEGQFEPGAQERVQMVFFTATFSVMGHLAKADGRVSEDEIRLARQVMERMGLGGDQRRLAMELFNEGKQPGFDLDAVLDQFRQECRRRVNLIRMFVEIQLAAALADGEMHPAERRILLHICERLGFPRFAFEQLERMARAGTRYDYHAAPGSRGRSLEDAYAILGVEVRATDAEVKKAYRRLMSQHHPDKLVSRGLPEEMMKVATEKTQEIKAAYEQVKAARGM